MKRIAVILLLLCFAASGVGLTMREHYCMGQFAGTTLGHPTDHPETHRCNRCGMEKALGDKQGCCRDKVKVLRSMPDAVLAKSIIAPAALYAALPSLPVLFKDDKVAPRLMEATLGAPPHGPPLAGRRLPIYLRVRCLRL